MINIEEIAKTHTREEFLNETIKPMFGKFDDGENCPDSYGHVSFDVFEKCDPYITCRECWKQAIKNIKFKDDMEEVKMVTIKDFEYKHNEGEEVVCRSITKENHEGLVLGQVYTVMGKEIKNGEVMYAVKDSDGDIHYSIDRFVKKGEIRVGDFVEIIDNGYNYSTDIDSFKQYAPDLIPKYANKSFIALENGDIAKVFAIGELQYGGTGYFLLDESTDKAYLMGKKGVKLYQSKFEVEESEPENEISTHANKPSYTSPRGNTLLVEYPNCAKLSPAEVEDLKKYNTAIDKEMYGATTDGSDFDLPVMGCRGYITPDSKPKKYVHYINGEMDHVDMVNHPDHYTAGGIEVIDYMKAKMTPEQFQGHLLGNVIKYTGRAGKKLDTIEDLKKGRWYLDRLITELQGEK